jgi:hypothetical protein
VAKFQTQHYWRIHRRVTQKAWRNMERRERETIAADVNHETYEFKRFEAYVNSETERLYNDESYPYNDPATFKASYREERRRQ